MMICPDAIRRAACVCVTRLGGGARPRDLPPSQCAHAATPSHCAPQAAQACHRPYSLGTKGRVRHLVATAPAVTYERRRRRRRRGADAAAGPLRAQGEA
eukprot:6889477-Prymnesium_polylepis.1